MFAVLQVPRLALQAVLTMEVEGRSHAKDTTGGILCGRCGEDRIVGSRPELPVPLVVVDAAAKKPVVLEMTAAAEREGVVIGLSMHQALARCEGLVVRYRSEQAERMLEQLLFSLAYRLSPRVESDGDDAVLVDLRGVKLDETLRRCEEILGTLTAMGVTAGIGVARSWVVAGLAAAEVEREVLYVDDAERVDVSCPGSLLPLSLGTFLKKLSLGKVAMGDALRDVLEKWGIRTVGAFAGLRRSAVGARLGVEGLALWDRLTGNEERVVAVAELPENFEESWEFEYDVDSVEPLLFLARRFLDLLGARMYVRHKVATLLSVELGLAYGEPLVVEQKLPEATRDAEALFRLLAGRMEGLEVESPVQRMALRLEVADFRDRQLGLFESSLKNPYRFTQTLSKVAGIIGAERVGRPVLPENGRPDGARMEALPSSVPPLKEELSLESNYGMPLRRFRPGLRAEVEFQGRQPVWIQCEKVSGFVRAVRGPWLHSGHWWEAEGSWSRVEWDVELNKGGVYRICKDDEGWKVEGVY